MIQSFRIFAVLFLCCYSIGLSAQSFTVETVPDPKQNPSSHYVSNPAGILSAATIVHIDSILGRLEDSATAQVAVVVLPSIGDAVPKDFANALFKKWGVGYAQKNNGLLMLFVQDQRRVEFETGYGLEGVLPDITCGRIQRDKMLPFFRNGDYNSGITAGVEAVAETLLQPPAVQEIHTGDENDYAESNFFELDMGQSLALAFALSFCLSLLWVFRLIVRSVNSVKREIDTVIRKKKGHFLFGVTMYVLIPLGFALLLGFGHLYEVFTFSFGEGLLCCYAYLGFLIWDSRIRRMVVFNDLYGKMTEPQQYLRLRTATRFYWFDVFFFPVPLLWLWYRKNKRLNALRNHPRSSAEGYPLVKAADGQKAQWLTKYQKVEEDLHTVEYDIWRNEPHNVSEAVAYESLAAVKYTRCGVCHSKALGFLKETVLKAATMETEGRCKKDYQCKACGAESSMETVIPIVKPASVSSGGTWISSGGSSYSSGSSYSGGSSSSWGGGRSGGGGAGSSW